MASQGMKQEQIGVGLGPNIDRDYGLVKSVLYNLYLLSIFCLTNVSFA